MDDERERLAIHGPEHIGEAGFLLCRALLIADEPELESHGLWRIARQERIEKAAVRLLRGGSPEGGDEGEGDEPHGWGSVYLQILVQGRGRWAQI